MITKDNVNGLAHSIISCNDGLSTRMGGEITLEHWPVGLSIADKTYGLGDAIHYRSANGLAVEKQAGHGEIISITITGISFHLRVANCLWWRVYRDLPGCGAGHSNYFTGVIGSKVFNRCPVKLIPLKEEQLSNEHFELEPDGHVGCDAQAFGAGETIDLQTPTLHMARVEASEFLAVDVTPRDTWESVKYWRGRGGRRVTWFTYQDGRWSAVKFRSRLFLAARVANPLLTMAALAAAIYVVIHLFTLL